MSTPANQGLGFLVLQKSQSNVWQNLVFVFFFNARILGAGEVMPY